MTEAQKKANAKYHSKFEVIRIRVPAGDKENYKRLADASGESLNAMIIRLLNAELEWKSEIAEGAAELKLQEVEVLELSVRSYTQIKRLGLNTIGDLIDNWEEIKPKLGKNALKEISEKLNLQ